MVESMADDKDVGDSIDRSRRKYRLDLSVMEDSGCGCQVAKSEFARLK